jgi:hypothetical protein
VSVTEVVVVGVVVTTVVVGTVVVTTVVVGTVVVTTVVVGTVVGTVWVTVAVGGGKVARYIPAPIEAIIIMAIIAACTFVIAFLK